MSALISDALVKDLLSLLDGDSWETSLGHWERMRRDLHEGIRDAKPVCARFAVPTYRNPTTGEPVIMTLNLADDVISNIPVIFDNRAGRPVPAPSGAATASIDNPAVGTVAVGADGISVDFMPTQPPVDGATANITYSDVVGPDTIMVGPLAIVVTADATATSGTFNTAGITTRPLAPPAPPPAPGP